MAKNVSMWTGFSWLRTGFSGGSSEHREVFTGSIKRKKEFLLGSLTISFTRTRLHGAGTHWGEAG
jgi:hypothetical protein